MIKTRLLGLLSHAKKYIVYQVVWQWLALLCQILMIYSVSMLLEQAYFQKVSTDIGVCGGIVIFSLLLRFFCDRQASHASYHARSRIVAMSFCEPRS